MRGFFRFLTLLFLLTASLPANAAGQKQDDLPGLPEFRQMCDSISCYLSKLDYSDIPVYVKRTDVQRAKKKKNSTLVITFCKELAFHPFREGDIDSIRAIVSVMMPPSLSAYRNKFTIKAGKYNLSDYRPKYFAATRYRGYVDDHLKYIATRPKDEPPLVRNISRQYDPSYGLSKAHITMWQSHGLYYENSLQRWEWQRSRLFGIVEDRYTQSYVLPLLVPMLENAGAVVLLPRERDTNPNEVIVDNNTPGSGYSESGNWKNAPAPGFACPAKAVRQGENPFTKGSARIIRTTKKKSESKFVASWIPEIPETGEYCIYVSYQRVENSANDARYLVRHKGGETWYAVNQKMCSEKWVYLGKFLFEKGCNKDQGVFLSNYSNGTDVVVSADAVRFGGGMGNIARGDSRSGMPECSGHPRFNEASLYWLQWSGFPDSVYSASGFKDDYKDDIKARGNWVNYLINQDNVPVDLSFAFHSDAGTRQSDSIVGTLAIYTAHPKGSTTYPSGESRMVSREYADIVQSQVVSDIRSVFGIDWTRRGLWDRSYAESSYPEVPSMILELLSHQNFWDMRMGLDPSFKFVVARAAYKGILKFHAYLNDRKYIVQPLPVSDFAVSLTGSGNDCSARLSWMEIEDPLEPTARADYYIVYTRIDDGGFDNGTRYNETHAVIKLKPGHLYSFKVAAVNGGGAGFPSETLCAAVAANNSSQRKKLLIVNNFNNIGAPGSFISQDSLTAGFRYDTEPGMPYCSDISYCGPQYEFRTDVPWEDDDAPGFGATLNSMENSTVAGNTFDFAASHASGALQRGYDIVSSSANAFAFAKADTAHCTVVDMYCGRRGSTGNVFGRKVKQMLSECIANGYGLILSGSDMVSGIVNRRDSLETGWFNTLTSSKLMTWYATSEGGVRGIRNKYGLDPGSRYSFHMEPNPHRYHVPHTDAIIPARKNCTTIYRYAGSNTSAGTFRNDSLKVVTLGFPVEALSTRAETDALMNELLRLFE